MSRNDAQRQGEHKEQVKAQMRQDLETSVQSVAMQARVHNEQSEMAAATSAKSIAMQARSQVEHLEEAAAQRILAV